MFNGTVHIPICVVWKLVSTLELHFKTFNSYNRPRHDTPRRGSSGTVLETVLRELETVKRESRENLISNLSCANEINELRAARIRSCDDQSWDVNNTGLSSDIL